MCLYLLVLPKHCWTCWFLTCVMTSEFKKMVNWLCRFLARHCTITCLLNVKESCFFLLFFFTSLLVAAFKLLPRQSRRKPQLQRNQLGVVGWRLMGNLLISPPFVCQYAWTAQPGGRQSLPKRLGRSNVGVWALLSVSVWDKNMTLVISLTGRFSCTSLVLL